MNSKDKELLETHQELNPRNCTQHSHQETMLSAVQRSINSMGNFVKECFSSQTIFIKLNKSVY